MVYFQTTNPNLGKFGMSLEWKMLVYFMTIWNIYEPLGILYGCLVWFVVIWYIFPVLVCLDHEKSGNPGEEGKKQDGGVERFGLSQDFVAEHALKVVSSIRSLF
jgi:hypothetical protein